MEPLDPKRPIVYLGPSLSAKEAALVLPDADFRPPIKRDDLYRDRERGAGIFLILDGVFGQQLAVSPREIIDVVDDGGKVFGASSMGALRAADCWPKGVQGVGVVYRLFRSGRLKTDDEVAVAVDPEQDHRSVSLALVNIRYGLAKAVQAGKVSREMSEALLRAAQGLFFGERKWKRLFKLAGVEDSRGELERFLEAHDLKKRDARRALERLKRALHSWTPTPRRSSRPFERTQRYRGVSLPDRAREPSLHRDLSRWLLATGRYHKYLWAILTAHPSIGPVDPATSDRPAQVRAQAQRFLRTAAADLDGFANMLWDELDLVSERQAELVRMHAVKLGAERAHVLGLAENPVTLRRVRNEVAVLHGTKSWSELSGLLTEDRLWGFIPKEWIPIALAATWRLLRTPCAPGARH